MYDSANLPKELEFYVFKQMVQAIVQAIIIPAEDGLPGLSISWKLDTGEDFTDEERNALMKECAYLFPEWYNPEAIPQAIASLSYMIKSKDYYIPTVIQEYVLAHAIYVAAEIYRDEVRMGMVDHLIPKKKRKLIKKRLINDLLNQPANEPYTYEEASELIEDDIRGIEDFTGIIDLCYYDRDFELLDDFTSEQLSVIDDPAGIGLYEPARKRIAEGKYENFGMPGTFKTIVLL